MGTEILAMDTLIGITIDGYRIVKRLGAGGMGAAYLGEKNGVQVVVKQALEGHQEQLFREAKFLASLKHRHLPAVLNFDRGFMIMELVPGETVEEHIDKLRQAPRWNEPEAHLRKVLAWGLQLADALNFLHTLKPRPLLHRDIKASNVMVRTDGSLCLIDFGIARFFDAAKLARGQGDTTPYGTAGWVAPEYVMTQQSTPLSDMYMVGVLLHYGLSGEQPDDNADSTKRKPLTPIPRKPQNDLWNGLVDISERLRHVAPERRPTAHALAAELKKLNGDPADQPATRPCPNPHCRRDAPVSCRFCPHCSRQLQAGPAAAKRPGLEVTIQFSADNDRTRDRVLALAKANTPAPLERFRAYLQLRALDQDPGFGELISLESLPCVDRLPHQEDAVKIALQKMRGWCLLADEVGLGKTIEAGLILKELMLRDLARKILILAPRDLCAQWQKELFDKFRLFFLVFGKDVDYSLAWQCDRVIAPYKVVEDRFHQHELLAQKFDLVIMDEAHHLLMTDESLGPFGDFRRRELHTFAKMLKKNYFLMLSATPMRDSLEDLHEMLTLLKPGSVGDLASFKNQFVNPAAPDKPNNIEELRRLLHEVMIRRERRLIQEMRFPRREAHCVAVDLTEGQRRDFAEFRAFAQERLWKLGGENRSFRHGLQTLVESFHSSPAAFAGQCETLLGRFRNLLPAEVQTRLRAFQRAMTPALLRGKVDRAAEILAGAVKAGGHKVLVFTQYEDTADLLYRQLPGLTGLEIVRYPGTDEDDGGNKAMLAVEAFRNTAVAMVCAENASEGLNLQFADTLINFDLPWDPMKLEQRIGRIQRLGQSADKVFIYNLFLRETVEEDMLEILEKKIDMFGAVVGHVGEILGNLTDDQSFQQVMLDKYLGAADANSQIDILVSPSKDNGAAQNLLNFLFAPKAPVADTGPAVPAETRPGNPACRKCGTALTPDMARCDQCNTPVGPAGVARRCHQCNKDLVAGMRFCDGCRAEVIA
jgi:serine/threonine protein kinase/ERCC4-related helicase